MITDYDRRVLGELAEWLEAKAKGGNPMYARYEGVVRRVMDQAKVAAPGMTIPAGVMNFEYRGEDGVDR